MSAVFSDTFIYFFLLISRKTALTPVTEPSKGGPEAEQCNETRIIRDAFNNRWQGRDNGIRACFYYLQSKAAEKLPIPAEGDLPF